jgi:DNA-binding FadR family transcriptional regulator
VGTQVRPRRYWHLLDSDVLAWRYEVGPDEGFLEDITEVRGIIEPPAAALAAGTTTSTLTWLFTQPSSMPAITICWRR